MSTDRPDDDVRSLLGAYALDAVDDVERRAVERLLERDPAAAAEVASLRAAAAELGGAVAAAPPPGLRAAVLAEVARTPQAPPLPATSASSASSAPSASSARDPRSRGARSRRPVARRATALVAAAAAVALVLPGVAVWRSVERAQAAEERAEVLAEALTDPGATLVRADVTGGGHAVAVLADDRAVLLAEDLPALTGDRVYQVWAVGAEAPRPAGFLDPDDGAALVLAEGYRAGEAVAVSVEPRGGSAAPTTDPVVVLARS